MANYLPVLLVSVTSNPSLHSVPDDTSIETLPRGQVDYLSHNWAEEDVWRSWRNMTRQKNEIANGMRLENASWRTWWKQRNKLKTVTPETLNWLKDSDVTWLYGPLHTAVDWTPPPKPQQLSSPSQSPVDRLDLSSSVSRRKPDLGIQPTQETKHKSILKTRSISELLMNDFPASVASPRFGMSPGGSDGEDDPDETSKLQRPSLSYTKSDTHVATLASSGKQTLAALGLRKDSPPRIGPPGGSVTPSPTPSSLKQSSRDSSELTRHSSPPGSLSPDSTSRVNPLPELGQKKKQKHIAFNTFVQQCIAIEQPKKSRNTQSSTKRKCVRPGLGYESSGKWNGKTQGTRWVGAEDEEDDEIQGSGASFDDSSDSSSDGADTDESPYLHYPYTQGSSSWYASESAIDSSDESDDVEPASVFEDDDDDLEVISDERGSRQSGHRQAVQRSHSKLSTSSSSSASTSASALSTSSTAETSPSPARDDEAPLASRSRRRRSSKSAPETPLHHRLSTSSQSSNATIMARRKSFSFPSLGKKPRRRDALHEHVTIAPIAPTLLKVSGVGNAWDGFGSGYGRHHRPAHSGSWTDGFGDEFSDDGEAFKWIPGAHHRSRRGDSSDDDRPVELVYVPEVGRFPSSDSSEHHRLISSDELDGGEDAETVYQHEQAYFSLDHASQRALSAKVILKSAKESSVPVVVRTPPVTTGDAEEDAYDYFAGPDLGEDFVERSYRGRRKSGARSDSSRSSAGNSQEELLADASLSRSRSRSKSRTPSPVEDAPPVDPPLSPTSSSTLLSPPLRNRTFFNSQEQPVARGRSSTRASSSSLSDRDRSSQSSPIGSLSPEGSAIGMANGVYGVYANGRIDRERDKERVPRKGRERGRERTERRLDHSISPDTLGTAPPLTGKEKSLSPSRVSSPQASASGTNVDLMQSCLPATPGNSPVITGFATPSISVPTKPDHPSSSSSPTHTHLSSPSVTTSVTTTSAVPDILLARPKVTPKESEGSIVGKAVGMVSSAGQYLGLWPTDSRP